MDEPKIAQTILIPIDKLQFSEDNPQEMTDDKFNVLVQKIKDEGFVDPLRVIPLGDGFYKVYAGEHRTKAALVAGYKELPCVVREMEDDKRKFEMVKDNIVKGNLNPEKFTKLVNSVQEKYGREIAREMFAMSPSEFDRYYQDVKKALPPELQKKLEEAKGEIKTIEDLSTILNKLFSEYGETIVYNFMILSFGKQKHLYVQCDKELWDIVTQVSSKCAEEKVDINVKFKEIFQKGTQGGENDGS
jgi:ParB/RepB/Spo0J family partition protein